MHCWVSTRLREAAVYSPSPRVCGSANDIVSSLLCSNALRQVGACVHDLTSSVSGQISDADGSRGMHAHLTCAVH